MISNKLPYSEIFYPLLEAIHKAIWHCFEHHTKSKVFNLTENDKTLNKIIYKPFEKFYKRGINKHISKGLSKDSQFKFHIFPRLSKLTIQAYKDANDVSKKATFKAIAIPSPLTILYNALTIPEEPQTSAYSLALCRTMLYYFLDLHPEEANIKTNYPHLHQFFEII